MKKLSSSLLSLSIALLSASPAAAAGGVQIGRVRAGAPLNVRVDVQPARASRGFVALPGTTFDGLANEAAFYAAQAIAEPITAEAASPAVLEAAAAPVAAAAAPRRSLLSVMTGLIRRSKSAEEIPSQVFGEQGPVGFRELDPLVLPGGATAGEAPRVPAPSATQKIVRFQNYHLPGGQPVSAGNVGAVLSAPVSGSKADLDALQAAVMARIDKGGYGVRSSQLRAERKFVAGRKLDAFDQADTVYFQFQQVGDGLDVHGAGLSITVKSVGGQAVIVSESGETVPNLAVKGFGTISKSEVMRNIGRVVGMAPQAADAQFELFQQKIVYFKGKGWRRADIYIHKTLPVMVAVDVDPANRDQKGDSLVIPWDNRHGATAASEPAKAVDGSVEGVTVDRGPIMNDSKLSPVKMAYLTLTIDGKSYTTDKDGRFQADAALLGTVGNGMTLKAALVGPHVKIVDQQSKTLEVTVNLTTDGTGVVVTFNKDLADAGPANENAIAQVNTFQKVNLAWEFLHSRGVSNERIDKEQLLVRTNIDQECNAYYTPGRASLNFFRSSGNCVNSGYDTVADHEYGHFWHDFTVGITNGGLSEGWGDIVSMFLLNNPVIGEHFLKKPRGGVDYIRHGENNYQYNKFDEVHAQGQAWGGFGWRLRKALIAKLGYEQGAAVAEALVLPTMFAASRSIPDAIAQVLVNATQSDGSIKHEAEIREAAKHHGITLPQRAAVQPGIVDQLLSWLGVRRTQLTLIDPEIRPISTVQPQSLGVEAAEGGPSMAKATFSVRVSATDRNEVVNYIRDYLRHFRATVVYGQNGNVFGFNVTGPERELRALIRQLEEGTVRSN